MATAKKAAPAKKAATKTTTAKTAAPAAKRAPNAAFMAPKQPSPQLSAIVGAAPLPGTQVTAKVWEYIKSHNLQDATNRRLINADAKLKEIFNKPQVDMFEMTKLINAHLTKI